MSIVHPPALCLIAVHHSHCKAVCRQKYAGTLSMTWYLPDFNIPNIISVTPVPLPQPGEKPLP